MKENFDVIVLGGGVNGCAVARLLAMEGKRVLLLERSTIGCGTSSNSSKLIHGGLRYLENLQFGLVRESLYDRKRLYEMFPDLVQMVPFYLPIYRDTPRPWWVIRIGLGLYDCFSRQPEYHCRRVGLREFGSRFPGIREQGLKRVYMYYDGKTDDLELTRRLAEEAGQQGCLVREHFSVEEIGFRSGRARVRGVGPEGELLAEARVLVNVTGPWIDEVNQRYGLPHNYCISKVSGIHIVVERSLVPDCMFLQTSGRRIFFMIPWQEGSTIIGTTERMESEVCDQVQVCEEDVDYLLECANRYLLEPLARQDVISTFLGIRPLIMDRRARSATTMSRDFRLDVQHPEGAVLVHVYGGKLTTCLSLAEKVRWAMGNRPFG